MNLSNKKAQFSVMTILVILFGGYLAIAIFNTKPTQENLVAGYVLPNSTEQIQQELVQVDLNRRIERPVDSVISSELNRPRTQPASGFLVEATELSLNIQQAIASEVELNFGDFIAGLSGDQQRHSEIAQSLIDAYLDIADFSITVGLGEVSLSEVDAVADPDYVINKVAELLSPSEFTAIETWMEDSARNKFLNMYEPQVNLLASGLSENNSAQLLETLFIETYLLGSANSLGIPNDMVSNFQRQIEAINNTRDNIRASLPADQFELANAFLNSQEQGLTVAQTIFSAN